MYGFGADLRKLDIKLSKIELSKIDLYTCEPRTDIGYVWSNCTLQDCTLEPNKTCIIDKNCK